MPHNTSSYCTTHRLFTRSEAKRPGRQVIKIYYAFSVIIIQYKLTTTAFALMILLTIISMPILFYICAMATWTEDIHNLDV